MNDGDDAAKRCCETASPSAILGANAFGLGVET